MKANTEFKRGLSSKKSMGLGLSSNELTMYYKKIMKNIGFKVNDDLILGFNIDGKNFTDVKLITARAGDSSFLIFFWDGIANFKKLPSILQNASIGWNLIEKKYYSQDIYELEYQIVKDAPTNIDEIIQLLFNKQSEFSVSEINNMKEKLENFNLEYDKYMKTII